MIIKHPVIFNLKDFTGKNPPYLVLKIYYFSLLSCQPILTLKNSHCLLSSKNFVTENPIH